MRGAYCAPSPGMSILFYSFFSTSCILPDTSTITGMSSPSYVHGGGLSPVQKLEK